MSEPDLNDTQPTRVPADTQPNSAAPAGMKRFPRWLPLLGVVILIAIGLLGGYSSGMGLRFSAQNTQVTGQLADQFQLGVQAFDAGQYEIAKQHFEAVLKQDPDFPGIKSAYADLLMRMLITPTATPTLTPTIIPTEDLRSAEEQYANAQDLLKAGDWDGTISKLDSPGKIAPTFHTAQVDGMYYAALYQRGLNKISPASQKCSDINLEGGIYDLTMAEHFGPVDNFANSLRTYARLYIAGSSFWDQDWVQAQDYFSQVMAAYPNMRDVSCDSATERWRQATVKYADQLAARGDFCAAEEQYNAAFTINSPKNDAIFPTATEVQDQCNGDNGGGDTPVETPTGDTATPTLTPTPGGETPTLTPEPPTETPTETPTP